MKALNEEEQRENSKNKIKNWLNDKKLLPLFIVGPKVTVKTHEQKHLKEGRLGYDFSELATSRGKL